MNARLARTVIILAMIILIVVTVSSVSLLAATGEPDLGETGSQIDAPSLSAGSGLNGGRPALTQTASMTGFLPIAFNPPQPIYFDDFSDPNSGWSVIDFGDIRYSYQGGEYEILFRSADWWAGASAPIFGNISQYSVEAEMRLHTGAVSGYGLIFERVDWDNFYLFLVEPSYQEYSLWERTGGSWTPLIIPTASSSIKSGGSTNRLMVERNGSHISLYVNDKHLASLSDGTHNSTSREVGLYSHAAGEAPVAARYDNFIVRDIGNTVRANVVAAELSDGQGEHLEAYGPGAPGAR